MSANTRRIAQKIRATGEEITQARRALGNAYAGNPVRSGDGIPASARQDSILGRHFSKGAATRYGYPPLSDAYAKRKAKQFPGRPQLVRTGLMKSTLVGHGSVSTGKGFTKVTFPGAVDYAKFHLQEPGARNFLKPNSQDVDDMRELLSKFIRKIVKAFNRRGSTP